MSLATTPSLRKKLVAVILLTTLVGLLVALLAFLVYELRTFRRTAIVDMDTQAALLGQLSAPALAFDDPRVAQDNLALLRLRPRVQAAAIYTARGARFASYVRPGASTELPALPEADGMRIEGGQIQLFRRIVDKGEILGTIYLRADYELAARMLDYLLISAAALALAMAAAWLLSSRLQRLVTEPVLAITEVAREVVERKDYSRRARKLSDDEVGVLVDSFNGMLDEIEGRTAQLEAANEVLAREVGERARAEQEVLQLNTALEDRVRDRTAQLEAANHELEAFAFSVSHDLRAPLRAVNGFAQALIEDFPNDVPEGARRYLERIRAAALRMGQLIEDLLNLSRVSRGALERVNFDLGEVAQQVVDQLAQHEPGREVNVSIWPGMTVDADPRLVRALLENLIGNAWKFTSKTPHPSIGVGVMRDEGKEVFYVRDNGAGFSMDYANKLFAPFQRLHAADEFPGTGIGLATVQRIVLRHGGRIWADAKVGQGAAFYFTLGNSHGGDSA